MSHGHTQEHLKTPETKLRETCESYFPDVGVPSLEVSKDFFDSLVNKVFATGLADEVFSEEDKKHLLFGLFCRYKRPDKKIFDQMWNHIEDCLFGYFPYARGQSIDTKMTLLGGSRSKNEKLLIDKFRHFCKYQESRSIYPRSLSFEEYYTKAWLNVAITVAWKKKIRIPKGFFATIFGVKPVDPEKSHYNEHLAECLSLDPLKGLQSCLQLLLNYFENIPQMQKDSYAYFLMENLVTCFDREEQSAEFRARFVEWQSRNLDLNSLKAEFCDELRNRYFNQSVVSESESDPELLSLQGNW